MSAQTKTFLSLMLITWLGVTGGAATATLWLVWPNVNEYGAARYDHEPALPQGDERLERVRQLAEEGQVAAALRELEHAQDLEGAELLAGRLHYAAGRFGAAITELGAHLARAPQDAAARLLLAKAHLQNGSYRQSLDEYTAVLTLDPENAAALQDLGVLHALQSRLGRAEDAVRRALELDPRSAAAHNTLGIVRARKLDFQSAARAFSDALKIEPELEAAMVNLRLVTEKLKTTGARVAEEWTGLDDATSAHTTLIEGEGNGPPSMPRALFSVSDRTFELKEGIIEPIDNLSDLKGLS